MKKILFVMSILCLALSVKASGQQTSVDTIHVNHIVESENVPVPLQPSYLKNVTETATWDRNWFIEVKGGASAFLGSPIGCGDVFDRLTPALQVGVGKWFTPAVGGRVAFQGFQFKNAAFATMKYQFVHADFMYNLTAFIRQNELGLSRWDVIPFVGIGMAHNSDWSSNGNTGHLSGSHPFAFSYGLEARYRVADRLHVIAELSGMTTMKNFDAIGTASRFGDNMFTLSAGLSISLGKVGYKKVVDAKPYIAQNEWLIEYANGLSMRNRQLTKQVHEDEQTMAQYRKILEIEGLLDLYKDRLTDKGQGETKALYPKNDYSGLNSLRARLANRSWDGNPENMPRAMKKRADEQENEDNVFSYSQKDANSYLEAMMNGKDAIGAPIYFFFHLGTSKLTEVNQMLNIDEIAKVAKKYQLHVKVVGAADRATGTEAINNSLSRQRAECIGRLLTDRGVDGSLITMVSEGGIDTYSPNDANRHTCVILSF